MNDDRTKTIARAESERFQSGAGKYAAYLATPEGRLRSDLAFANLQDFIGKPRSNSWSALDLGAGTGTTAVRLARLGMHVTLLDSSPAMLDIANALPGKRACRTEWRSNVGRRAIDGNVPRRIVRCNFVSQPVEYPMTR